MRRHFLTCLVSIAMLCPATKGASIRSNFAEILGTHSFDFETETLDFETEFLVESYDIRWRQVLFSNPQIDRPFGSTSSFIGLGDVDFAAISESELLLLAYSADPIIGPPGGTDLDLGNVFAVKTQEGNYAKVQVILYDEGDAERPFYDMTIRYELYDGALIPEPSSGLLLIGSLASVAMIRRKR